MRMNVCIEGSYRARTKRQAVRRCTEKASEPSL
jgi:hypothetical protein